MASRTKVYFVSDVHLGMRCADPAEREERFVSWLRSLSREETHSLYLLGDIWDFWYEYRDVIPREGTRVVAQLISLMDAGVQVHFIPGNHDIWCYSFFESIGIAKHEQPYVTEIGGKTFCLGHGDLLGGARWDYRLMIKAFHFRPLQILFSTLHPWLAFRFGLGWSGGRRTRRAPYRFRGEQEPLYRFAVDMAAERHVDHFVFGHFHDDVDMTLPGGERFVVLGDWIGGGQPFAEFDLASSSFSLHLKGRQ